MWPNSKNLLRFKPSSPVFSLSELGISHLGFPGTPFSNILSFRLFVTQALLPGC